MDEADGRPGHVALQFGHLDAFDDAPALSLRVYEWSGISDQRSGGRDQGSGDCGALVQGIGAVDEQSFSIFQMTFTSYRMRSGSLSSGSVGSPALRAQVN
jgi:hypothetical protein